MNADEVMYWLVVAGWPPAVIYAAAFGWLARPWWKSSIGRAHFVLSSGIAAVLVVSFLFQTFGADYIGRDVLRVGAFGWTVIGIYYVLGGFVQERLRMRVAGTKRRPD